MNVVYVDQIARNKKGVKFLGLQRELLDETVDANGQRTNGSK